MAGKYYAVRKGRTPGVYTSWEACRQMVDKYPGAQYKSFRTPGEARAFAGISSADDIGSTVSAGVEKSPEDECYAFVDGSFNASTGVYGYGGFLVAEGVRHVLQGSGREPDMAGMRNVAGEVLGSIAAMEKARSLGIKSLTIYYDYTGIEMWATGAWKRNKKGTIAYYDYVQRIKSELSLRFVKVKGHTGVEGNEEADRLARQAAGLDERE